MDGRSNFVLDKGGRKADLKAKHLGRREKAASSTGVEAQ
jgi:hypothetical protein